VAGLPATILPLLYIPLCNGLSFFYPAILLINRARTLEAAGITVMTP